MRGISRKMRLGVGWGGGVLLGYISRMGKGSGASRAILVGRRCAAVPFLDSIVPKP